MHHDPLHSEVLVLLIGVAGCFNLLMAMECARNGRTWLRDGSGERVIYPKRFWVQVFIYGSVGLLAVVYCGFSFSQ